MSNFRNSSFNFLDYTYIASGDACSRLLYLPVTDQSVTAVCLIVALTQLQKIVSMELLLKISIIL